MTDRLKNGRWSEGRRGSVLAASFTLLFFLACFLLWTAPFGYNPTALIRFSASPGTLHREMLPRGCVVLDNDGYDGQSYYYVSRDLTATKKIAPAFRYQRIGLPALAALFGGLGPQWAAGSMVLMGMLLPAVMVFLVGSALAGRGVSPWWALPLGINPGTVADLFFIGNSTLMALLIASGAIAFARRQRTACLACWSCALLVRESAAVSLAALFLYLLFSRRLSAWWWLAAAALPLALWELYLAWVFGGSPLATSSGFLGFPGRGLLEYLGGLPVPPFGRQALLAWSNVPIVVLLTGAAMAAARSMRRGASLGGMGLLLNSLFCLSLSYDGIWAHTITSGGRMALPVCLWAVLGQRPGNGSSPSKGLSLGFLVLGICLAIAFCFFPVPRFTILP